jgi:alkylated DNA repair dioxygenase AlkB
MPAQAELFGGERLPIPAGMRYFNEIISKSHERELVAYIANLPLKAFEFAGGFKGNRRVMSFGWRYDYTAQQLHQTSPIPDQLAEVRRIAASRFKVPFEHLAQALVTEYAPGAGIGWHRDKKMFGEIIGVSLLAPCKFRLRLKKGGMWDRMSFYAEPRSGYLLSGAARTLWEHSIPPLDQLRYSITFRTLVAAQRTQVQPRQPTVVKSS